jgi:hypothetical protein
VTHYRHLEGPNTATTATVDVDKHFRIDKWLLPIAIA